MSLDRRHDRVYSLESPSCVRNLVERLEDADDELEAELKVVDLVGCEGGERGSAPQRLGQVGRGESSTPGWPCDEDCDGL